MTTPSNIRPNKENWVSVLSDRREEKTSSGLFLPGMETGVEKVSEGAGTIVRVGKGKKIDATGIKPGDRIVYRSFLKYAHRLESDEKWEDGSLKHYFMMSIDDVLGIISPGTRVGVFSGRPMIPSKEQ